MQSKSNHFPEEIIKSNFLIKHNKLNYEVTSCIQAALAKGIPVKNELKSIILSTSKGYYAVHMCGDRKVNLREVKTFLECKQASLCSTEELAKRRLAPGKVCPLIKPTWGFKHLISRQVLQLKSVSTNDGTRTGYYTFSPKILLLTKKHQIGLFTTFIT